ncbi:MAG: sulfite exporter TauE/SafE family protein [Chitinispirillia bacterium]|nr:sulfite exporter TauE/SafE family protein [Chitinispirillia bacterium]MCL2242417.1 sulfite exporter TauE/SafE family protein [Chitinispirillia bacterium]
MEPETPKTDWQRAAGLLIIIAAVFIVLQQFEVLNLLLPFMPQIGGEGGLLPDVGYGMLFVIGLLTSVHCVAMCGGINLSQCLPRGEGGKRSIVRPSILYNFGRVTSYTIIGAAAGALGSAVTFSLAAQGALKLIAGALMVIVGVNMLHIFPWMRRITPRMPKFINAGAYQGKGPFIVGLLNGLMPCGPLLAVQLFALSTGSPLKGAASLALFCLGTVPLMFGLGTFSSAIGKKSAQKVMTAGAVMVAVLGLYMLSQGWNLAGVSLSAARHSGDATLDIAIDRGPQIVNSTLSPSSYPSIKVEVNRPVRWVINAPQGNINGCNYKFFIGEYGVEHELKPGDNIINFTPRRAGSVPYTCWMGMIKGTITVVKAGDGFSSLLENRQRPPARDGAPCCPKPASPQTNSDGAI